MKDSFLPPLRLVWSAENSRNARELIGRSEEFQSIWNNNGVRIPPGGCFLFDYGKEIHGGIRFLLGRQGTNFREECPIPIRLRFGESVSEVMAEPDNQHAIHDLRLTLAPMGETRFGNTGFRFILVNNEDSEKDLNLLECSAFSIVRKETANGEIRTSDPVLNRIWEVCRNTLDACALPLLVDGAKRDRLVWMGDLFAEIRAACTFYGKHPAIAATLDFILKESLPSGKFNNTESYTPYWFMSQMEYYRLCGDDGYLLRQKEPFLFLADQMLAFFENNPKKVMETELIDWSSGTGERAYAPLYACGCSAAQRMATFFGAEKIALRCRKAWKKIREECNFKPFAKSSAAYAAISGIRSPKTVYHDTLSRAPENGLSTFHFDSILTACSLAGKRRKGTELLRRYYGGMLELGASAFWEHFELSWMNGAGRIDELPVPGKRDVHKECGSGCFQGYRHSLCHGWASAPAAWMMENLLGIFSLNRGYAEVRIVPDLCDLEWVEGRCPTPFGPIRMRKEKKKKIELDLPAGIKVSGSISNVH